MNSSLTFSSSEPTQKSWFTKKVVPVIRKVAVIAGKVNDISGKVAVIASIL
jgi:hypothetical protein